MGYKISNGVDNARLWFKDVRVPRENLLGAFSQVSEKGDQVLLKEKITVHKNGRSTLVAGLYCFHDYCCLPKHLATRYAINQDWG